MFLTFLIVLIWCIGTSADDDKISKQQWNEGHCPRCKEKWVFVNGDKSTLYYKCPKCDKVIRMTYNPS